MATRDESVLLRSLLSLVGKHCPTEFDKYQVLEERDKLLSRLRDEESKKNHEKGKKVEGLCLGMCTEKERYVRVVQKRISPYECDSNGLEPSRMVKEYARSAADQDNPLAHELRSKDLLKNTMDYLLAHVLDSLPRGDDDLATWYDFLWSRTRAIRKEITQLMLTDGTAIALFERCSRLHILCAYKLCHLGFDRFDQNMNTENLAKCLQSLRHLYEDLEVQGETFETEAEFRGYDVMLHLHDSNIMRQVLSYRKEVRESQPVRLALQLSSALQNKNYVRFFRLLKKEATFLQCCICHRYFDTVLSNALHTMMTAYGRHSAFLLETAYLVRVLAWDDRDDALNSLALYGVHPNDMSNDQVCFDRDVFVQDPDAPSRPYCWVDAKNRAPWSQVVYGPQPFSFFSIATMTDSFDDSDCYNKDPVLAAVFEKYSVQPDAQLDAMQNQTLRKPVLVTALRDEHREAQYWVNSTVENMVHEVADEESLTICKDINMERVVFSISESLIDQSIRDLLVNIMEEEWKERERERAHIKSERLKEEKVKFIYELSEKLLDEVVDEKMKSVINLELRDGVRVYVDATTHLLVEELWRSKLWHSVDKETKAILQKLLRSEMNEITSGLQRFRHQMELLWLRQFWDVWRARVIENRRKRQERRHDWESFQGVWNCRMFSPSNYVGSSNAGHHSGVSSALVDSQKIRFKLKLVQFKKARLKRIMRKYFCKWQYYVENRRALQHLVKKMLYRPKTIGLAPVLPLPFSYARAKRKRTLSPGSLEYSLLERSAPHGIHDTSCDSRFSVSWRQSMEHHHEMLLPERGQYRYDELEITRPFRPPSPEPEEYHVERKECSVDAARYDQKCNSFLPEGT
ncbi:PCI domain-containing protein [Trichostrongylus colubriformis]|uniref:PCI domain-containing protein n=1 Tax=Trichostrongylus colubriformis TaxID=6319 RepID=A0AAN8ILM1_TRICO